MKWCKVNKWLHFGNRFILMFDNWCWIGKQPTIRQWSLFEIMWDNGAWWGDLPDDRDFSVPVMTDGKIDRAHFTERSGTLPCFIQVVILGIGFRLCYDKQMKICWRKYPVTTKGKE